MSLETELSPKYRDMFLDPIFQNDFIILSKHLIKTNPEYRAEVKDIVKETYDEPEFTQNVEYALLDSESNLLPRLKDVEIITGLNTLYLDDEEHAPTLPERIEALERNTVLDHEFIEDAEKPVFISSGKVEKGAVELVKLAATMKPFNGGKYINNAMFHHFRLNILPDELKPTEKGKREWKKEVVKVVKRLVPDVWTENRKAGNRGMGLAFPRNFSIKRLNVILT